MDPSIRALFHPEPGLTYLDTATYGLPPDPTLRAMREAEDAWQAGTASWVEWDKQAERARSAFGRVIGAPSSRVALMPSVSTGVGLVAADLQPGDRVVMPAAEFTSVLFPLLVARERGVEIVEVDDVDRLVEAIAPGTTLVALFALAEGAARYDVSFGWITWLGAAESLELLVEWQASGALEEPVALARSLADRLGVEWGGGTLVCPPIEDADRVRAVLAEHRIKAAFRGTALRLSTHVYNDDDDVERAVATIGPFVGAPVAAARE